MIKLEVEKYCENCPYFKADVESTIGINAFTKEKKYCNTVIRCEERKKCKNMMAYLFCETSADGFKHFNFNI